MQITFTRWCVDPSGRTNVSVDPRRVDATEEFTKAAEGVPRWDGDDYPRMAATRIVMKNKQEYLVQGDHDEVVALLNASEKPKRS